MKLVKKILNKFNGMYYKQEYLCLDKKYFQYSLHAYIVFNKTVIKDITNHHLFIGYHPLVFTFSSCNEIDLAKTESINIVFSHHEFQPDDLIIQANVLATLYLQKIDVQHTNRDSIYYYKCIRGEHHFISSFHQFILQLQNRILNNKPGNVYLHGNLLKQVQIAYAIPRIISLITVSDGNLFNLFPTDLHGQIDEEHYVISLRHGGKAAQQVETAKRILVTEIDPAFYQTVYSLGKNHMKEFKTKDHFPFSDQSSATFLLPLPQCAVYYRELELKGYFDHGIHRFFLLKIIKQCQVENKPATLAHVHNVYATWRHNKGLPGNYLFR